MSPLELIAMSLGTSIAVAVVAGLAALGLERVSGDPVLRERAWATALYLPGLPPLAVALMLLTPAPVVPASVLPTLVAAAPSIETTTVVAAPVAEAFQVDWGLMVMAVLVLTGLLVAGRLISLGWRARRLNRLIAHAVPASDRARDAVAAMARGLGIVAPAVRCSDGGAEALLAGLVRPVLILPESLAETPDGPAARAVIAHELAHLKRGDHRAVWVEEAIVALLAVNPVLPLIRARRAAAREEACDALALGGAEPAHRRAYAQSLIEALRARTDHPPAVALPALTFTGTPRSQAMRRLKSILAPPATAGRGTRATVVAAGVVLLGLAGAGSVAVAAQRAPQAAPDTDLMPLATGDHAYVGAAMDPIFKAAWPGACGFGSEGSDGQVFVHAGEGCPTLAGPRILIRTLAGADPSADPRAAFVAVKSACDAGRPVEIAFTQGGRSDMKTVACASAPVAPPEAVRLTADIAYDPAISIAAGDQLEITLNRDVEGGGTASTGMVLDLAPGAMPGLAFADLRPPLLPADRNGSMFAMSARIVGTDGTVKALSDRDLGRPHAPYVSTATAIRTRLQMVQLDAATQAEAARQGAARAARAAAASARQASGLRDETPQAIKASCRSGQACDGLIDGFVIHQNAKPVAQRFFCAPERADRTGQWTEVKTAIARTSPIVGEATGAFVTRVLAGVYPCRNSQATRGTFSVQADGIDQLTEQAQAALPQPAPGTTRLWLTLDSSGLAPTQGDKLIIDFSGEGDGVRYSKTSAATINSAGMPDVMFLDLGPEYFPSLGGANRGYALTARVERGDQVVAAGPSATVRLAAGSQSSITRLRPLLRLAPVAP